MPAPANFTFTQTQSGAGNSTVLLSAVTNQTYYVLVYPQEMPAGSSAFTLGASGCGFTVTSVNPGWMADWRPDHSGDHGQWNDDRHGLPDH